MTYEADVVAEVMATALTDPQRLGLRLARWTPDRLQAYLNEETLSQFEECTHELSPR